MQTGTIGGNATTMIPAFSPPGARHHSFRQAIHRENRETPMRHSPTILRQSIKKKRKGQRS